MRFHCPITFFSILALIALDGNGSCNSIKVDNFSNFAVKMWEGLEGQCWYHINHNTEYWKSWRQIMLILVNFKPQIPLSDNFRWKLLVHCCRKRVYIFLDLFCHFLTVAGGSNYSYIPKLVLSTTLLMQEETLMIDINIDQVFIITTWLEKCGKIS